MNAKTWMTTSAAAALALTGTLAAPALSATTHATGSTTSSKGQVLPSYPGQGTQKMSGVIVDYLSYVTQVGTRGELNTGNGGANGGGNGGNVGGGGRTGTGSNMNEGSPALGGGGNNGGGNNGGGTLRPLGLVANGKIYLLDLPAGHRGLSGNLARDLGRTIGVLGRVYTRAGGDVIVVSALM